MKAVVCHEFLHVLLRHTERTSPLTPSEHLALDAVINAIIHRELGTDYSGFMSALLRGRHRRVPAAASLAIEDEGMRAHCVTRDRGCVPAAWYGLYEGDLVADDIRDLARDLIDAAGASARERRLARRPRAARTHADGEPAATPCRSA